MFLLVIFKLTLGILVADQEQKKSQVLLLVILKLTLDIPELQMKSKKKVLGVFISNFENYTRYL